MTSYQATFSKRFGHFWTIYIFLLVDIAIVFYSVDRYGSEDIMKDITIAALAFLLFFLPTFFVHSQYYRRNANDRLLLDSRKGTVEYIHGPDRIQFGFDDIELLEQFQTPPLIEDRWLWFPWASYNYTKIHLNSQREIIVTCFLVDQFDLPIDSSKKKLVRVLFPNIKRSSSQPK